MVASLESLKQCCRGLWSERMVKILMQGWVSWGYIAPNVVGDLGVIAKTTILITFKWSRMPGSGLPCWAHPFVECVIAKQGSWCHSGTAHEAECKVWNWWLTSGYCQLVWPVFGKLHHITLMPALHNPGLFSRLLPWQFWHQVQGVLGTHTNVWAKTLQPRKDVCYFPASPIPLTSYLLSISSSLWHDKNSGKSCPIPTNYLFPDSSCKSGSASSLHCRHLYRHSHTSPENHCSENGRSCRTGVRIHLLTAPGTDPHVEVVPLDYKRGCWLLVFFDKNDKFFQRFVGRFGLIH